MLSCMPRAGSRPHSAYRTFGMPGGHVDAVPGTDTSHLGHVAPGPWVERAGAREALRRTDLTPPPVDHPPLLNTLCVLRVSLLPLSLSPQPQPRPQRHKHRAPHMTRALGFHAPGGLGNCLGAFPGAQRRFE